LFRRHEAIQNCHVDTQRVKNAIDLAQKDIFQKRQVAISLAAEVQKQKELNGEIDKEIDTYKVKFDDVQGELASLDQQIQMYEDLICEKDNQIEGMKVDLVDAEKKKKQEEEHFKQQLLDEAAKRQQRDWYVPTTGDKVDEMFAHAVNSCPHVVHVTKLGDGKYTYGSKTVFAKMVQENLVIRVSGGYMLVEEFLKNYAEAESKAGPPAQ